MKETLYECGMDNYWFDLRQGKAERTLDNNNRQASCSVLFSAQCASFNYFMASEVNLSMEGPLIWEKSPRSFIDVEEKEAPEGRNERSIVASALSGLEVLRLLNTEAYVRLSRNLCTKGG